MVKCNNNIVLVACKLQYNKIQLAIQYNLYGTCNTCVKIQCTIVYYGRSSDT